MGRLSGMVAIAKLRVLRATSMGGSCRRKSRTTATKAADEATITVIWRAIFCTSTWKGVGRSVISPSAPAISPTSVAMPVRTATARRCHA